MSLNHGTLSVTGGSQTLIFVGFLTQNQENLSVKDVAHKTTVLPALTYQLSQSEDTLNQADCFLYIMEVKKGLKIEDKTVMGPLKTWIENNTRKKYEWMVVIVPEAEAGSEKAQKTVKKAAEKVRAVLGVKDERRVATVAMYNSEEREEVARNMAWLIGQSIEY